VFLLFSYSHWTLGAVYLSTTVYIFSYSHWTLVWTLSEQLSSTLCASSKFWLEHNYARDLLERVLQRKLLEQIYIQNMQRNTYARLSASAREMGRAQELFLINTQSPSSAHYYQGQNYSSSSALASGTTMDIGAADASSQERGKGPHCYNCQLFGHIACECMKPCHPHRGQQQARAAQAQPEDDQLNTV